MSLPKYFVRDERNQVNHLNYYYFQQGFTKEQVQEQSQECFAYYRLLKQTCSLLIQILLICNPVIHFLLIHNVTSSPGI